jgi:hypothetical protein
MSDIAAQRDMLRRMDQTQVVERPRASYGTAFPTSPATGYLFFRTDLGWLCYYDGTRWLTAHEYTVSLNPFGLNPLPFSGAGPSTVLLAPVRSDYRLYHTRQALYIFISPTNSGVSYWSVTTSDSGATAFWGVNTSADAAGQITKETSLAVAGSVGAAYIQAQLTKSGTPSNVTAIHVTAYYRLVVP